MDLLMLAPEIQEAILFTEVDLRVRDFFGLATCVAWDEQLHRGKKRAYARHAAIPSVGRSGGRSATSLTPRVRLPGRAGARSAFLDA
jgi:hypothetical protein